ISAAVGYIAVFGVSVLNGVVLVSSIRQAYVEGLPIRDAIVRGCELRFRPIVVSAIVAVIGFLPAALSHDIGAEIQQPLARVVIGGLISSTVMTLLVLPSIYVLLAGRGLLRAGLREALPLLVEVRAREEDRDHLLAAAIPEPEAPGGRGARSALGREEGTAGDAADPPELGTPRPAVVADAEVEVPRP